MPKHRLCKLTKSVSFSETSVKDCRFCDILNLYKQLNGICPAAAEPPAGYKGSEYMKKTAHRRAGYAAGCILFTVWLLSFFNGTAGRAPVFADEAEPPEKEISVDVTGEGEGFCPVLYDNTNGLPTSEANAIAETEEGFIWIGSYSGLIRYDGNTFERFDSGSGIASVTSLYPDSQNRLWIGTNDSGAAYLKNGQFTYFNKSTGLPSLSVRAIAEDGDGYIYLGTTDGLAVVDPEGQLSVLNDPNIRDEFIRTLHFSGNVLYGVTKEGSVFTVTDGRLTAFTDAEDTGIDDIHAILADPNNPGYAYIGNQSSAIYYVNLNNGFSVQETYSIAPQSYVNSLEWIGDMIWVCTDTGIGFLYDSKYVTVNNLPMTTSVEGMIRDYQKNLWFVSSQQGVMKIVPDQFTDIYYRYKLGEEVVYSTCIYDEKILVGTKSSGLRILGNDGIVNSLPIRRFVSASGVSYPDTDLVETLHQVKIRSIIRDSRNRVWFSTFSEQGLLRYDNGEVLRFTEADGLPSNRIRTVYECADGTFLAACTGGLALIKDDCITAVYNDANGIDNTEILTVTEGLNGEIVVGTDGGGIYVIKGRKILHYDTENGLPSDIIMRIKKDPVRKVYWLITSNAIAYLTEDFQIHTVTNFPYSNNFDLYENSSGELWILSSNGIYVTDADHLMQNPDDLSYLFYNRDNGLPCIPTSNSYSDVTESGDLYIAATTGIAKVNIEIPFDNVSELKMAVPFLQADSKTIYPDSSGTFHIPASTKKLTIFSYVYNYSLINPTVTYRLKGFDTAPVTLQRSQMTPQNYTNLSGGNYHFELEIQDSHGINSKKLNITIVKEKKIYERLWLNITAILLTAFLLFIAVRLYIKRRTRAIEKRHEAQRELTREIVEAFAKVIDMKDRYTNGHSARVAEYTVMLCRELGLDEDTIDEYYCIALLHDIGKIGIPPEVLNKNGKLTDEEFRIIKSHSGLGYNTLKDISILPELATGAGAHHERPDGKGYPKGLKGDEIPRVAQIIAVADTFDAMYSDRPYRKRMNYDKAVSIIKEGRGTQLTADVVDAFLRLAEGGKLRAKDDTGGGTTEDINNIHSNQKKQEST